MKHTLRQTHVYAHKQTCTYIEHIVRTTKLFCCEANKYIVNEKKKIILRAPYDAMLMCIKALNVRDRKSCSSNNNNIITTNTSSSSSRSKNNNSHHIQNQFQVHCTWRVRAHTVCQLSDIVHTDILNKRI